MRLAQAMRYWERYLEPWNVAREEQIELFASTKEGRDLLPDGLNDEKFVPLVQMTAIVATVVTAYNAPKFRAVYDDPSSRPFAERYQAAINEYVKWIDLDRTLRNVILDSRFGWGVVKTYLGDSPWVMHNPIRDSGVPQVERVSQRNFLWDASVSELRDSFFLSDRYFMVYDDAMECPRFDKDRKAFLTPFEDSRKDAWHHPEESRAEELVGLVDVYFPRERLIATWMCDDDYVLVESDPLCVQEWTGDPDGPYDVLALINSPDRLIPVSPTDNIECLAVLFNLLMRKMAFRAMEQKQIATFEPGSEQEMARMLNARDLDVLSVTNRDRFGFYAFPGVDQTMSMFSMGVLDLFKMAAGGFDLKAGLGPASGTARQDEMIAARGQMIEAEERRRVGEFVSKIGGRVGKLIFDDPYLTVPASIKPTGTNVTVDATWYPEELLPRQGSADDYGIDLVAGSMDYRSSEQQIQAIEQAVMSAANVAQAAMPLGAVGVGFNLDRYMEILADYRSVPELKELFVSQAVQQAAAGQSQYQPKVRPAGPREYIRRNVSEQTNSGQLTQNMSQMPGAGSEQPAMM